MPDASAVTIKVEEGGASPPTVATCYSCGATLEPVFDNGENGSEQWDNALVVCLEGGYGMFIDPLAPEPSDIAKGEIERGHCVLKVVICHDCAHKACEQMPWLDRLIEPLKSHAHRYGRDWADHEGWDLPHKESPNGQAKSTGQSA